MAEVSQLTVYPLTGGRGEDVSRVTAWPYGFKGDRDYVFYDPETNLRVSEKEVPELLQFGMSRDPQVLPAYTFSNASKPDVLWHAGKERAFVIDHMRFGDWTDVDIDEFGDKVEALDVSTAKPELTSYLSTIAGKDIRLAIKKENFHLGPSFFRRPPIAPAERANAPVHIITEASAAIFLELGLSMPEILRRFRANMVVRGTEQFEETDWPGKVLRIGERACLAITQKTRRCPVPGRDSRTGENMKDIPTLYRSLPKADNGKPSFGVYGYPIPSRGVLADVIRLGDTVEVAPE